MRRAWGDFDRNIADEFGAKREPVIGQCTGQGQSRLDDEETQRIRDHLRSALGCDVVAEADLLWTAA